jgi:hypothetical protein
MNQNDIAMTDSDDRKDQICTMCCAGRYQETSIYDDWDGVLHCTNKKCNHEVKRYKWKDNPKPQPEPVKSKLFPAAQAIDFAIYGPGPGATRRDIAAAALRAAADQVVPPDPCGNDCCITQCEEIRAELLAIAAELEGDSKENERPDRLIAGDVWEFELEVQVKGKRKPQPQKLKFKVIGYHHGQCAWQLASLDGEHYCYLLEFAPQYEDMTYIGHLDQDELEGSN